MARQVPCPNCKQVLKLPDDVVGKSVLCYRCQSPFVVPAAPVVAPPAPTGQGRCPACQAELRPGAKACLDCGHLLGAIKAAPVVDAAPLPPPPAPQPKKFEAIRPRPATPSVPAPGPVEVKPSVPAPGPVAVPSPLPAPVPEPVGERSGSALWALLPALLLLLALGGVLGRDLTLKAPPPVPPHVELPPYVEPTLDPDPRIDLVFDNSNVGTGLFYVAMTKEKGPNGDPKLLTFYTKKKGFTNCAGVRIDDKPYAIGKVTLTTRLTDKEGKLLDPNRPFETYYSPGDWEKLFVDLKTDTTDPKAPPRSGKEGTYGFGDSKVYVTETVEVVPGRAVVDNKRFRDTCRIRFRIENRDTVVHKIGGMFLLDTYIGSNDGVPFTIPGQSTLCDTCQEFKGTSVPDFLQALEFPSLEKPGTVAHLTLKVGKVGKDGADVEPPDRVLLTRFAEALYRRFPTGVGNNFEYRLARWEAKLASFQGDPERQKKDANDPEGQADSSVVLYWDDRDLSPGAVREIGFEYGLGYITSAEGGKIAFTAGGSFAIDKVFSLTALVSNPTPNQTVTLTLPEGLTLAEGNATQAAPPSFGRPYTPVTWKVKATQAGRFEIKGRTDTGVAGSYIVDIPKPAEHGIFQ